MSIWKELRKKRPLFVLAPMEDVTDSVFRRIIADCGRPDVFYTEFTNCEGAQSVGQANVVHRLKYTESERPIIAQVWGITPEDYYKTAVLIREMGFDGIDINMGCPVKKIIKQGACSALIKNPTLAQEIVEATKQGAGPLPVSIKTRVGFGSIITDEWIGFLLEKCAPEVLTVHGRTVKEESKVPNHWDEIGKAVVLRDEIQKNLLKEKKTLIIGNGDILSYQEGVHKIRDFGLDGVMIGRGVFHNPWIFDPTIDPATKTKEERLALFQKHVELWHETWGESKNFQTLKKYCKIYIQGFPGASQLRSKIMECRNKEEVLVTIQNIT